MGDDDADMTKERAWDVALAFTLAYEGGYADNPSDPGGETFRGISRKNWPGWEGWQAVDAAKSAYPQDFRQRLFEDMGLKAQAVAFYRRNFWDAVGGDELPPKYAVTAFDMAVHSGVKTAVRILQYIVGVHVDGKLTPETVKACHDRGEDGVVDYLAARAKLLHDIMTDKPAMRVWARNWFRRLFKLANIVLEDGQNGG